MELGEKLKAARLEAGLSQRQLCGDIITRNMLSQIENGSAKPSYTTLQALCVRLSKPVSYFLEDAPSQNLGLLHKASQAQPKEALELLKGYLSPDPMLDEGYHLLCAGCLLSLAEKAISDGRISLAHTLLQQARQHGNETPSFGDLLGRRLCLLQYQADPKNAPDYAAALPDNTWEQLLRAEAALAQGDTKKCLACLISADRQTARGLLLESDARIQEAEYEKAIACLLSLEETPAVYARLELCYRELGNFERAYYYACKQR